VAPAAGAAASAAAAAAAALRRLAGGLLRFLGLLVERELPVAGWQKGVALAHFVQRARSKEAVLQRHGSPQRARDEHLLALGAPHLVVT
jgi:hypothetical protein